MPDPVERGPLDPQPAGEAEPGDAPPEAGRPLRLDVPAPAIPGYAIEGLVGRGSTGVVYRARQLAVDREVALKVLHSELARRPRVVQRLQREARTTARLAHPHIVSAIDMGQVDGLWWYAMEYVDGPSLATRLKQEGRLREREILRLLIPLCEALVHAWEHSVVHRDIKPGNILIDRVRGALLADLGLAFADDDPALTGTGGTLGTPHYMSPEQARSPAEADVRSDLWSFGATLFHALCGRAPFGGESVAEVLSGVLYGRIPDPHLLEPRLSKGIVLVLRKCLTRDPEARYQTPRELLLDLERVRERRQPKVSRRSLDPVARRPRHWPKVAALGAAALAVAALWGQAAGWLAPPDGERVAPGGDSETFAPLESLAGRLGEDGSLLFAHLTELEQMEAEVPAAHRGRWIGLRTDLRGRLRSRVSEVLRSVGQAVEERVQDDDYVGALAVLERDVEGALFGQTGYTLDALPEDQRAIARTRLGFLRSGVESSMHRAARGLQDVLERYARDVLLPRVGALRAQQRWSSAHALLEIGDEELLERVDYAEARFPSDVRDEALEAARLVLFARATDLDAEWRRVDRELSRWLARRSDALEARLREGALPEGAAEALRDAFAAELEERGLAAEELPLGGLPLARGELEDRAAALASLQETLREERARSELESWLALARPLWGLREYGEIRDRFEGFAARLARGVPEVSGGLANGDVPWREELRARAELVQHEAGLLEGLLERAAAEVRRLDGSSTRMRLGSITLTGTVSVQGDPLARGFTFTPPGGEPRRIMLRNHTAGEIERLAGLRTGAALPPEERLRLALFRFHEDDPEGAHDVLREDPVPPEGPERALFLDLNRRVLAALERAERAVGQRTREARILLEHLEQPHYDEATALGLVGQLLEDYGDLPEVRGQRGRLRAMRDRLRTPARPDVEDFERVFALPRSDGEESAVERVGRDRVRMRFDFVGGTPGAWEPGVWVDDLQGWVSTPGRQLSDLERRGPRLVLRSPLDVEQGVVELRIELEQPYGPSPPKCTIVSVVGFHFALVGSAVSPEGPRWLVENGDVDRLLTRIAAGEGTRVESLLEKGARHHLRFRVSRRPGSVEFSLDGTPVYSGALTALDPAAPQVSIRAWEAVRLLRAEVEAGF